MSAAGTSAPELDRFLSMLDRAGASHARVAETELPEAVAAALAERGVEQIACSDDARVQSVRRAIMDRFTCIDEDAGRDALFSVCAGVSGAQYGIAETGTLMLMTSHERNRLVSLVPPGHVAIVPRECLLADLGVAFEMLSGTTLARTVTFVTGPSRTADIELTLVVGVHGPRWLHVIVVE